MIYYITPQYSLALIPKCGCSTFARSVIQSFQPNENQLILNAAYPTGITENNIRFQWMANKEKIPSKPILAFIRDPLQRFLSAMVQLKQTDVESTLSALEQGTYITTIRGKQVLLIDNAHFKHQYYWLTNDSKLYKFPDHIDQGAQELGLILPLPTVNASSIPKPVPTQEQEQRILEYYSMDKQLYDSISSPGIILSAAMGENWLPPSHSPPVSEELE